MLLEQSQSTRSAQLSTPCSAFWLDPHDTRLSRDSNRFDGPAPMCSSNTVSQGAPNIAGADVAKGHQGARRPTLQTGVILHMTRAPIVVARAMLITGLVLLALAITALAVNGLSGWGWLLGPLGITVIGSTWMGRVEKHGTIVTIPKHAAQRTR